MQKRTTRWLRGLGWVAVLALVALSLAACSSAASTTSAPTTEPAAATEAAPAEATEAATEAPTEAATESPTEAPTAAATTPAGHSHGQGQMGGGPPAGRGPGGGRWTVFHQEPIPEEFANLTNPMPGDPESIERGKEIYQTHCAVCHGETGMGEAEAGQVLDPPALPLARTTRQVSDAYLYWRIHDGGLPFGTAMPAYGNALTEQQIWDVINYIRYLSEHAGDEAQMQAEMLAKAVAEGIITQEEADLFQRVHALLEEYKQQHEDELKAQAGGNPDAMMELMFKGLIEQGLITEDEAKAFQEIHDRLHEAGVMP
ncbi:MAG: cytochrome c [Chloroflexi bacterium]|nr:cytochrome c [Chloroflexota bacterium]